MTNADRRAELVADLYRRMARFDRATRPADLAEFARQIAFTADCLAAHFRGISDALDPGPVPRPPLDPRD